MSITIILAIAALLGLVVIFAAAFILRGLKTALISTGAALIIFALLYAAVIIVIVNSM